MTRKDTDQTEDILDLENELQWQINQATASEEALEANLESGQIYQAEEELVRLRESLARAQADYQNLLRRMERDRSEMSSFITGNIVTKLLSTVDNLARAMAAVPADIAESTWIKGIEATQAGFTKQLENLGVKSFDSIGNELDTNLHEVMSQAPGVDNVIMMEFEKGYMLHDRVIRHAKVVVGSWEEI